MINLSQKRYMLTALQMSGIVGGYLRHDAQKLGFTTPDVAGLPNHLVQPSQDFTVSKMLESASSIEIDQLPCILYDLLPVPIQDIKNLEVIWISRNNREDGKFQLSLAKTAEIMTLRDHLFNLIGHTTDSGELTSINIFSISNDGKRQRRYANSMQIGSIIDGTKLYAEVCLLYAVHPTTMC